jgi:hypothetical protein
LTEPEPADFQRLQLLLPLYGLPPAAILGLVSRFLDDRRSQLKDLYGAYRNDDRLEQVARAPEALLLLERLEHDSSRLEHLWRTRLPLDELEQVAAFFGVPL